MQQCLGNLMKSKREQFRIQLRKERTEQIFKQKRVTGLSIIENPYEAIARFHEFNFGNMVQNIEDMEAISEYLANIQSIDETQLNQLIGLIEKILILLDSSQSCTPKLFKSCLRLLNNITFFTDSNFAIQFMSHPLFINTFNALYTESNQNRVDFTDLICNILSEFQQDSSKMLEIDNKFKILDQLLNTAKTYGASVDFIASIFTVFTMFTRNSDYNLSLDYYFQLCQLYTNLSDYLSSQDNLDVGIKYYSVSLVLFRQLIDLNSLDYENCNELLFCQFPAQCIGQLNAIADDEDIIENKNIHLFVKRILGSLILPISDCTSDMLKSLIDNTDFKLLDVLFKLVRNNKIDQDKKIFSLLMSITVNILSDNKISKENEEYFNYFVAIYQRIADYFKRELVKNKKQYFARLCRKPHYKYLLPLIAGKCDLIRIMIDQLDQVTKLDLSMSVKWLETIKILIEYGESQLIVTQNGLDNEDEFRNLIIQEFISYKGNAVLEYFSQIQDPNISKLYNDLLDLIEKDQS